MKKIIIFLIALTTLICCAPSMQKRFDPDNIPAKYSQGEWPPEKIYEPPINYPKLAEVNGFVADVWVSAFVDSAGNVTEATIEKVIGKENVGFEEEALDVARNTIWRPLIIDGKPTGTQVAFKITFSFK